jgi:hypothetical protein
MMPDTSVGVRATSTAGRRRLSKPPEFPVDTILNSVGASASMVGLVASILALRAARTAKDVAVQVRAEMRRRGAREEADSLLADARELSALVVAQQWFAVQRSAERLLAA